MDVAAMTSAEIIADLLKLAEMAAQQSRKIARDKHMAADMREAVLDASLNIHRHYMRKDWERQKAAR